MAGFSTQNNEHLIRSTLWTNQLKTLLMDELMANRFVRTLEVPSDAGSSTINIPSMGEAEVATFTEGQRIKYNKFDSGNYQFTFDQYKYSANSISEKFKRDSFYSDQVIAAFLPRQHRALMVDYEIRIFSVGNSSQTASGLNAINNGNHRWVGSGTNETFLVTDAATAQFSLKKANVPLTNLIAVVDPSVVWALQTQANVVNLLSPMYGHIISDVTPTGMRFAGMNIYGFDVYSSNYLPACGDSHDGTGVETVNGLTTGAGICNFFFSAAGGDISPWVGAWRQMPTVYSEFNKDTQETEYFTICEWGVQGDYRPENKVVILTDTDQVG